MALRQDKTRKGLNLGACAGARMMREGGGLDEYKRIGSELVTPEEMQMHQRYVAGTLANNWPVGLPADFLAK
jgi:hypothetical protein